VDVVILALRVLLSLGAVLALLLLLHRRLSKMNGNRAGAGIVSVVARQGIGAKASVVVLDAEGTRFYLGVTEQSVSVLHSSAAPRALQAVSEPDAESTTTPVRQTVPESADTGFAASLRLATSTLPGNTHPEPGTRRAARAARVAEVAPAAAPLAGSILSPATWKQTATFLRQGRAG
jgi:flagellar protein FliO/FliZ